MPGTRRAHSARFSLIFVNMREGRRVTLWHGNSL
jgi:hypothetical protein